MAFCKAEAVLAGFLKSTKMEQEVLAERKFMQALQLFEHANQVQLLLCHPLDRVLVQSTLHLLSAICALILF